MGFNLKRLNGVAPFYGRGCFSITDGGFLKLSVGVNRGYYDEPEYVGSGSYGDVFCIRPCTAQGAADPDRPPLVLKWSENPPVDASGDSRPLAQHEANFFSNYSGLGSVSVLAFHLEANPPEEVEAVVMVMPYVKGVTASSCLQLELFPHSDLFFSHQLNLHYRQAAEAAHTDAPNIFAYLLAAGSVHLIDVFKMRFMLFSQSLLNALVALHDKGRIHGDASLSNLICSPAMLQFIEHAVAERFGPVEGEVTSWSDGSGDDSDVSSEASSDRSGDDLGFFSKASNNLVVMIDGLGLEVGKPILTGSLSPENGGDAWVGREGFVFKADSPPKRYASSSSYRQACRKPDVLPNVFDEVPLKASPAMDFYAFIHGTLYFFLGKHMNRGEDGLHFRRRLYSVLFHAERDAAWVYAFLNALFDGFYSKVQGELAGELEGESESVSSDGLDRGLNQVSIPTASHVLNELEPVVCAVSDVVHAGLDAALNQCRHGL